jgi:hypothetical protein
MSAGGIKWEALELSFKGLRVNEGNTKPLLDFIPLFEIVFKLK